MDVKTAIANRVLVKITATWIGSVNGIYDGQDVVFSANDLQENWRELNMVWVKPAFSRTLTGVHHLNYKRRLTNVRYEYAEVQQ